MSQGTRWCADSNKCLTSRFHCGALCVAILISWWIRTKVFLVSKRKLFLRRDSSVAANPSSFISSGTTDPLFELLMRLETLRDCCPDQLGRSSHANRKSEEGTKILVGRKTSEKQSRDVALELLVQHREAVLG